jgi:hypothetical protein
MLGMTDRVAPGMSGEGLFCKASRARPAATVHRPPRMYPHPSLIVHH